MDYERNPKLQRLFEAFKTELESVASMVSTTLLTVDGVQRAAWNLNVYPSKAQIHELHMSLGRSDQCVGLQFYEFCLLITFLQGLKRRHHKQQRRAVRKVEPKNFDVFLGGACNPTTWRSEKAVPFCENKKISFFNPQVEEWSKELVESEAIAKETSLTNLFVLDDRVRGTSSMVEMGFLSGASYNLLPVIPRSETRRSVGSNEEDVSDEEEEVLSRATVCLTDLLDRRGYPIFTHLDPALQCLQQIMTDPESRTVFDLTAADGAVPVFDAEFDVGILGSHLLAAFLSHAVHGSDRISVLQVEALFAETFGRCLNLKNANGYHFSFVEVALLVSAYSDVDEVPLTSASYLPSNRLLILLSRANRCFLRAACRLSVFLTKPSPSPRPHDRFYSTAGQRYYDVYLGGSCGNSGWRDNVVIPKLQAAGASFYNPQATSWHLGLQPVEARARELSRVLLFVITKDTLSVANLVEAAHFIGRGSLVVLFVEPLPATTEIATEQLQVDFPLSPDALKDYTRSRHYLQDVAERCGVAMQPSIEACAERVISILQTMR